MKITDIFQPSEETMEGIDVLAESLKKETSEIQSDFVQNNDCTGCWGGTCSQGITG